MDSSFSKASSSSSASASAGRSNTMSRPGRAATSSTVAIGPTARPASREDGGELARHLDEAVHLVAVTSRGALARVTRIVRQRLDRAELGTAAQVLRVRLGGPQHLVDPLAGRAPPVVVGIEQPCPHPVAGGEEAVLVENLGQLVQTRRRVAFSGSGTPTWTCSANVGSRRASSRIESWILR